jgi:ABC-type nitrate/sulfonate/bicarbonate transport system substrate-binding protein
MRKFMIATVAAFAGIAFATAAQAQGDCGWSNVASTSKPIVTADSTTTPQQTPIATATKKGG